MINITRFKHQERFIAKVRDNQYSEAYWDRQEGKTTTALLILKEWVETAPLGTDIFAVFPSAPSKARAVGVFSVMTSLEAVFFLTADEARGMTLNQEDYILFDEFMELRQVAPPRNGVGGKTVIFHMTDEREHPG